MKKKLVTAAVALLLPIGMVLASDPPEVKEGLWSIHRQIIDSPGNNKTESTQTLCRSHAYDQHAQANAKKLMKDCTSVTDTFEGGKHNAELRCTVAGRVIVTKEIGTYQSDTAFHSESHSTYTPAMGGVTETTMIMDQKYVGSCPAGMQPGDMTNADGRVTHLWKH